MKLLKQTNGLISDGNTLRTNCLWKGSQRGENCELRTWAGIQKSGSGQELQFSLPHYGRSRKWNKWLQFLLFPLPGNIWTAPLFWEGCCRCWLILWSWMELQGRWKQLLHTMLGCNPDLYSVVPDCTKMLPRNMDLNVRKSGSLPLHSWS